MNIYDFALIIRQSPSSVARRCRSGEIKAKQVFNKKFGGWRRWEVDDNYIKNLLMLK